MRRARAMGIKRMLRSTEVASLARVSLRQLQFWDEQGLINPRHNGHTREYSPYEVQRVIALGKLRSSGSISLARCRKLLRFHHREIDKIVDAITFLRKAGLTVR